MVKCSFCPRAAIFETVIRPQTLEGRNELPVRHCGRQACRRDWAFAISGYDVLRESPVGGDGPICHMADVRRKIARKRSGRPAQVPVACSLDVLDVMSGGDTWSSKVDLVTCPECRAIVEAGAAVTR